MTSAVQAVTNGDSVLSPAIVSRLIHQMRKPVRQTISQRVVEILQMVANDTSNRDIAEAIFASEATVKTHLLYI